MTPIRIDAKTIILVPDNKDPEKTKEKFLEKLRISREKGMRSRISRFILE